MKIKSIKIKLLPVLSFSFIIVLFISYIYNFQFRNSYKEININEELTIESLNRKFDWESAFNSYIRKSDSAFKIYVKNKIVFNSKYNRPEDLLELKNNTFKSSIYCLSFLRNSIIKDEFKNLSDAEQKIIFDIVEVILNSSKQIPLLDKYILYDHPVAERLETLLLLNIYMNKPMYGEEINRLMTLLNSEDFFNYRMNHGLMQLRAQLSYMIITGDKSSLRSVINRLKDIFDIYFAADGSILESASGYQLYIYNQFSEIFKRLNFVSEVPIEFTKRINLAQDYLKYLVTNDGFLQGTGDSYNQILNDKKFSDNTNIVYRYQNQITGTNLTYPDGDNINLQFISLDNKPNVHKLKEDLSIYYYFNQPIFINSGTYSYEKDSLRMYILSKESQNGPKFINSSIQSSTVEILSHNDSIIKFKGEALDSDNNKIVRYVNLNLNSANIDITDTSNLEFLTKFIVHPDFNVRKSDVKTVFLESNILTIKFTSNKPIKINDIWISPNYLEKEYTKSLTIMGDSESFINLSVDILENNITIPDFEVLNNIGESKREVMISEGNFKYGFSQQIIKINNIIFILIVFHLAGNFFFYRTNILLYLFNICIIILIMYDLFFDNYFLIQAAYLVKDSVSS